MHGYAYSERQAVKEEIQVALRDMRPDERSVVADTWAATFRPPVQVFADGFTGQQLPWVKTGGQDQGGKPVYRWTAPPIDHMRTKLLVDHLLDSAKVEVCVATLPDLPDDLVGYVVFEAPGERALTLHYLYTMAPLRRHRIGTQLFGAALQHGLKDDRLPQITHLTQQGKRLLEGLKR